VKNIIENLWDALDHARGVMEVPHVIELFAFVALIAKEAPDKFHLLANTGQANQISSLKEAGFSLRDKFPEEVCSPPDEYKVDLRILNIAISVLNEINEFSELASALREFMTSTGKFSGEMSSNESLEHVFKALVGDCSGKSLYDGASGLAWITSSLNAEMLYLEEVNYTTWVTAFRLLALEDKHFELTNSNSLLKPRFKNVKADLVVTEPPMSLKFDADIRRELAQASFIIVPTKGPVPASAGDALWIQHALSHLNEEGKAYIMIPQGFLFRGGYDAKVREYLLEHELLEAVIGLPQSILNFTSLSPVILVLNKNKPPASPVHFIDASEICIKTGNMVLISEEDARLIADLATGKLGDDPRFKAAYISEIRAYENNLSISRYITKELEIKKLNLAEELKELERRQDEFTKAQQSLTSLLNKFK